MKSGSDVTLLVKLMMLLEQTSRSEGMQAEVCMCVKAIGRGRERWRTSLVNRRILKSIVKWTGNE